MEVIDSHVHAFPDGIASRAISRIEGLAKVRSVLNGTASSLLRSMDAAGIERSVVLSIATRPSQFDAILAWSRSVQNERILCIPSVHPADPCAAERVRVAANEGFRGLKFHPYYQDFDLDDPVMDPVYAAMEEHRMICVSHTGFDHAYPFVRRADPARILRVIAKFPRLSFVATHLGAWRDWDLVAQVLPGARVWVDVAYSLQFLRPEAARRLMLLFPSDRLLFGSDSPWAGQQDSLALVRALGLDPSREKALLGENARALFCS